MNFYYDPEGRIITKQGQYTVYLNPDGSWSIYALPGWFEKFKVDETYKQVPDEELGLILALVF